MSHAGEDGADREMPVQRTVEEQICLWADELRSIANEGLRWMGENPYDVRRYQRILDLAAAMFALQDTRDLAAIERVYHEDLGHITPYTVGDAAIFNQADQILLIQRKDNRLWAMPGGIFEVGETPAEGACREAWEETGLKVVPVGLSAVYDNRLWNPRARYHAYQFVFLCRPVDEAQRPQVSDETLDVRWCAENELATFRLDPTHAHRIHDAFRRWSGDMPHALFDPLGPDDHGLRKDQIGAGGVGEGMKA